jgi:hypothetical protein
MAGGHIEKFADSWRISADFRDNWNRVVEQFKNFHIWEHTIGPNSFPDGDYLLFGTLNIRGPHDGMARMTRFSYEERISIMTLWSIARSPLVYGGELSLMRADDLRLLQNKEVLAVNQHSSRNRQYYRDDDKVIWVADVPDSKGRYIGLFNQQEKAPTELSVNLSDLGFSGIVRVRDLWLHRDLGEISDHFSATIAAHGAGLYKLEGTISTSVKIPGR